MLNVPQWCDVTKHTTHSYTVSKVTVVLITVYRRMVAVVWMFNETEKQYYCQIWLKTSKGYPQGSACLHHTGLSVLPRERDHSTKVNLGISPLTILFALLTSHDRLWLAVHAWHCSCVHRLDTVAHEHFPQRKDSVTLWEAAAATFYDKDTILQWCTACEWFD